MHGMIAMDSLYLGVDMGTSSMKATVADARGETVWRTSRRTGILNPRPGFFEVDTENAWWGNFLSICAELKSAGLSERISGLCVSSVCATFLPVDGGCKPLHNAILYGIDTRAVGIADGLNARFGADFLDEKLGGRFSAQSILPKILWLKRELPDVYAAARAFVPSYDAVNSRLTGKAAWDVPTAFGALLLEIATLDYPSGLLSDCGVDADKMPPVKGALSSLAPLSALGASATGLREEIPVMTGTGDINAEAMSAGAADVGTATVTLGSTISMLLNCAQPVRARGFISGASVKDGTWRIGAATTCGGLFLDAARAKYGFASVPEKPTGIFCLPYENGARCPYNNPNARAGLFGAENRAASDISQAACETIGYDVALLIDKASRAHPFPESVHLTGGLCRDAALVQLIADITGKRMLVHSASDASYGSALIASGAGSGVYPDVAPDYAAEPDAARSAAYAPLKDEYIALCDRVAGTRND